MLHGAPSLELFGAWLASAIYAVQQSPPVVYVPSIKRRRLGVALRRLREQSGQTTDDAAKRFGWSKSKVSRIETAAVTVVPDDVRALLGVYDVLTDEVEQLVTLTQEDRQHSQQPPYKADSPSFGAPARNAIHSSWV